MPNHDKQPNAPTTPPTPVKPGDDGANIDAIMAGLNQTNPDLMQPPPETPPPPAQEARWGKAFPRGRGFGASLQSWWQGVQAVATPVSKVALVAQKNASAVGRGLADAADSISNTVVGTGGAIVHGALETAKAVTGDKNMGKDWEAWYNAGDMADLNPLQIGEARKDFLFGKKQGGWYDFVENATQFVALAAPVTSATKPLMATNAILRGAKAGLAARSVIAGAVQSIATDPRAQRLSDMIENGPPALSNPLTQFLKSKGSDSEALARLKSGLEGTITGAAMDGIFSAIGNYAKSQGWARQAQANLATNLAKLKATPVNEPIAVVPNAMGGFNLVYKQPRPGTVAPLTTFQTAADAESHAAAMNAQLVARQTPPGTVVTKELEDLIAYTKNAPRGATPDQSTLSRLFNFNWTDETSKSRQTLVASMASELTNFPNDMIRKVSDMAGALDRDSWLPTARASFDILQKPETQALATARALLQQSLTGRLAAAARAYDVSAGNKLAMENMQHITRQLLSLTTEIADVASGRVEAKGLSGAGKLLVELRTMMGKRAEYAASNNVDVATVPRPTIAGLYGKAPRTDPQALEPEAIIGDLLKNMDDSDWAKMARNIRLSGGDSSLILPSMLYDVAATVAPKETGFIELVNTARANLMLSGPKGRVRDAISSGIQMFRTPVEYYLGGAARGNTQMMETGADLMEGMWTSTRSSWKAAKTAWDIGTSPLDGQSNASEALPGGNLPTTRGQSAAALRAAKSWLSLYNIPLRLAVTGDTFFKQLNYLQMVQALSKRATREAIARNGTTNLATKANAMAFNVVRDMETSLSPTGRALNPIALNYAQGNTFQTELTGVAKTVADAASEHPWLRLVVPFLKIPTNVVGSEMERTPILGLFMDGASAGKGEPGQEGALKIGRQALGTMVWGTGTMLALNGSITGSGPTSKFQRAQWLAAGYKPYSVRIPGTQEWMPFKYMGPIGIPLAVIGDMVEMSGEMRQTDIQSAFTKFTAGVARDMADVSLLGDFASFFDAAASGNGYKLKNFLTSLGKSFTPAIANDLNPDDYMREARGFVESMKSRLPGFSTQLEPRRNYLGEPVMKPPGHINRGLNPFATWSSGKIDPVQDEMLRLGKSLPMPAEIVNGVDLTDRSTWRRTDGKNQSPYDAMLENMGSSANGQMSARQMLTEAINDPSWKTMSSGTESNPGGERLLTVTRLMKARQMEAMNVIMEQYPGLADSLMMARQKPLEARSAPDSLAPDSQPGQAPHSNGNPPLLF